MCQRVRVFEYSVVMVFGHVCIIVLGCYGIRGSAYQCRKVLGHQGVMALWFKGIRVPWYDGYQGISVEIAGCVTVLVRQSVSAI